MVSYCESSRTKTIASHIKSAKGTKVIIIMMTMMTMRTVVVTTVILIVIIIVPNRVNVSV